MEDLDLDGLLDDLEMSPVVETPKAVQAEVDQTTTTTKTVVDEVQDEIPTLAVKTTNADEVQYSSEFLDIQTETKKYMQDVFAIESEIKALRSQITGLKDEAKDMGVPVTAVGKAIKEMIKEIKETPDEAHNVEMMKRFINEDNSLYTEVSALASL